MGSAPLRQFLRGLCCNSPWDYAVFWKIQQHQNELHLLWEDGLSDTSRIMNPMEGLLDSFGTNYSNEWLASTCGASSHTGSLTDGELGVAIAKMSSVYYVYGKGLVGEVAFTQNPSWISLDEFIGGGISSNVISDCPGELFHQLVAGIKTMLLVPLVPDGVLQLGSLDVVKEDDDTVNKIKSKFITLQQFGSCSTESITSYPAIIKFNEDLELSGNVGLESHERSHISQMIPMVQDSNQILGDMMALADAGSISNTNMQEVYGFAEPVNHQMWELSASEILLGGFPCFSEEIECLSNLSGYGMKHNQCPGLLHSYSDDGKLVLEDYGFASCQGGMQVLKFPTDCELHKALGQAPDLKLSDQNPTVSLVRSEDTSDINISPCGGSGGSCPPDSIKAEYLLEAVVADTSKTIDDSSSDRTHSVTCKSSHNLGTIQSRQDALAGENHVPQSCVTTEFSGERESAVRISPSASSFGCTITSVLQEPLRNGNKAILPTKGSKVTDGSKKRGRSSQHCHKPRPRDRQLIQDRIKELRDLIPNGSKCSIDALLDRTIKHMQFMTSVNDRANKVRQHKEKKVSTRKIAKVPKQEGNYQNGTSWALDYDNELSCPILVKDLDYPGHMLIEMHCGDNSRFLEIADVIHRLDLTIINGSVETRSDDSAWARFVVEASGSFHRLDIFWPLMQLLQQDGSQPSCKIYS